MYISASGRVCHLVEDTISNTSVSVLGECWCAYREVTVRVAPMDEASGYGQ